MVGFTIDLAGRVKNFDLPKNQPLIPLYEAVVNSIFAIQERQQKEAFNGKVEIEIIRDQQEIAKLEGIDRSINEITGFKIIDNGIGLDENNMKSFLQSDSTYRADKGGKGVGRFSWLKAFSKTCIESIFKDYSDNVLVKRNFEFSLDKAEIDDDLIEEKYIKENRTCVSLVDYLPTYRKHVNKNAETIAMKLMQHCMIYLMFPKCPQIYVIDDKKYNLNSMFEKKMYREPQNEVIDIKGESFELLHTQLQDATLGGSKLFLFANNRMVKGIDLNKEIVDLDKNIFDDKGYYYVGILSGKFLDDNVDMNRTSFDISENKEDEEISMEDIVQTAKTKVEGYLSEYLDDVRKNKKEYIRKYIRDKAPQFGHLLTYMPDSIDEIKPGLSDNKLDEELYKIKRKFDSELKKTNEEILRKIDVGVVNLAEYKEKFEIQFQKISEANKAALAEYVAHRKVVLELLKKGINLKEDGKFNKEAYIHNLIYPMRRTSEEIEYLSHNLWLIDERLAYSEYISSDIPFDNNPKEERTDVMILDNPVAVSDEDNCGREYETIVIIELKKPMRDDYTDSNNPLIQMLGYVEKLSTNKVADKNGRIIKVGKNTQFYLYAVCDITPSLKKIMGRSDLKETPDKMGLYKYHENCHAYIEILSFDKIINDAEKRNRVLFDKLGV